MNQLGDSLEGIRTVGRTLLDPVQNELGEIGRCLAVSGYFCGPIDDAEPFSGSPCQCRRLVKKTEEQDVSRRRIPAVHECTQDRQTGLHERGLEHDEGKVRT